MDRYDKIEKNGTLGAGTYGIVYKARDRIMRSFVALKRIKATTEDEGISGRTLREVSILRQLDHPNVVRMNDVFQNDGRLYLVFEFVERDLKKFIEAQRGQFPKDLVKSFAHQLLVGLSYCHVRGVMHRDIKPQNILITSQLQLKIADFGISRVLVPPIRTFSHEVVTLWYRPPEVLLGVEKYFLALDMWAVGLILAEMSTKMPLFRGDSEIDQILKVFRIIGTPTEATWPGVTTLKNWNGSFPVWPRLQLSYFVPALCDQGIDLLEQLVVGDPRKRLSANEAIAHPFFADLRASKSSVSSADGAPQSAATDASSFTAYSSSSGSSSSGGSSSFNGGGSSSCSSSPMSSPGLYEHPNNSIGHRNVHASKRDGNVGEEDVVDDDEDEGAVGSRRRSKRITKRTKREP